ncbi:hypothetical protein RIMD111065_14260 [Aeromonas hydrophila]|nr:hypothetical protein [Aeromonas hydrophila]BCO13070.1 hypothetical protein RIMD111065_14260 [Aeromonas hydrophila]
MYYAYFVASSIDTHEPVYGYFYPANIIDHYIYYNNYLDFKTSSINLDGVNNIGIAILYYYYFGFLECIGIDVAPEVATLILNLFVFFLCFISFKRIVIKLGLDVSVTWLFVFNSSFWYFAQLMNKDVFTIFILFKIVEYSMAKKMMSVFAIFVFSMMIRVQIPALILVYLFLIHTKPSIKNFTAVYVIISLFNGYISRYQTIFIGQETLADGFSSLVYSLNVKYGIGSLFLNPLRLVQSLYSVFDSFDFVYRYGVDVSKLKNIPQVMILIILLPYILKCFYHYKYYMNTKIKYVIALIPSFFLIWFLNPTINSRYVMLIVPFLTLIGVFYFKYRRDSLV